MPCRCLQVALRLQGHAVLWALLKWGLACAWLAHVQALARGLVFGDWACSDETTNAAVFGEAGSVVEVQARMSGVLVAVDTLHLVWLAWCYRAQKKSEERRVSQASRS